MSPAQSRDLLSALSVELGDMVKTVESLSALVAAHVRQSEGESRIRALVDAQAIDALGQRLEALSGVTGAAARGEDLATALSGVRLNDLSVRLGGVAPTGPAATPVPAGDLMLFES